MIHEGSWEEYQKSVPGVIRTGDLTYNTKVTKAGDYLYVDCYPVVEVARAHVERSRPQSEKQRELNIKRAMRQVEMLGNANFGEGDLFVTLTHAESCSEERAVKDCRNMINKLKRRAKENKTALKYIYVMEGSGEGDQRRWHIHMLMNGGWIDRDEVERLWRHGLTNTRRVQESDTGVRGLMQYFTRKKETQERLMKRRFSCSQNLVRPVEKVYKRKITKPAANRIRLATRDEAKAEMEKRFKGYAVVDDIEISYSDLMPGAYIRCLLKDRSKMSAGRGPGAQAYARARK